MWHVAWSIYPHNPWLVKNDYGLVYRSKPGPVSAFNHYATVAAAQKVADKLNRQEAQDENISLV
jgi:hypothetical protein